MIAGWNETDSVFGLFWSALFNHAPQTPPSSSGTAWPYQGPKRAGTVTAAFESMAAPFGYPGNPWCRFDGVNDRVTLNVFTSWTNTNKWSFEAFVHYTGEGTFQGLYAEGTDANNYMYCLVVSGKLEIAFYVGGALRRARSNDVLSIGVHHILFVKDLDGTFYLYIDGVEIGTYQYRDSYNLGNVTYSAVSLVGMHWPGYMNVPWYSLVFWCATHAARLSASDITAHSALGPDFDGIRGEISGSDLVIRDPKDDAPVGVSGLVRFGDNVYGAPAVKRGEYLIANETFICFHFSEKNFPESVFDNCSTEDGSDVVPTFVDATEIPLIFRSFSKSARTCHGIICFPNVVANTDLNWYWQCGGSPDARTKTIDDLFPDTLVQYPCEDISGDIDDAMDNYNGVATGLAYQKEGQLDKAVEFDGVTPANVLIGPMSELAAEPVKFTHASWFKTTADGAISGFGVFDRVPADTVRRYIFRTNPPSRGFQIQVRNGASSGFSYTSNPDDFFTKHWHHALHIFDGSLSPTLRPKLLLDGILLPITHVGTPDGSIADLYDGGNAVNSIVGSVPGVVSWLLDEWSFRLSAPSVDYLRSQYFNQRTYRVNGGFDIGEAINFIRQFVYPVSIPSAESFGQPTVVQFLLNEQQAQAEIDLEEVFFNDEEFAEDMIWHHTDGTSQNLKGIFDHEFLLVDPETQVSVMSRNPLFSVQTKKVLPRPAKGDYVVIRGREYEVIEWQPDGVGVSVVTLQNRVVQ